ncbi:MAG TPA: ABC transporter ATP-binding protein [Actinophytocola sp.]|uniref:ABC transporter ATP-binding protein n=1 Tax=Actinophytocola sp. TaxID=1872138 RepID=UPI002DF9C9A2|nr:ABC transporter ATP-binding protein [Actinophytocola sp.]
MTEVASRNGIATLEVRDLVRDFVVGRERGRRQILRAVDGVSFDLVAGQTLALVGESGSGKSTVASVLAQLIRPTSGTIRLGGKLIGTRGRALRRYREEVQIVFQDPFASLNPFHTVDHHLRRPLRIHHRAGSKSEEDEQVLQLLERVNLFPVKRVAGKHPHELSGGQRQRVAIARALAPRPSVLLADEPVSMLDVSIRLEILNLIDQLKTEDNLAVLYITHDLATARHFSSRVIVMYRGEVVESGPADEVILAPKHPYTQLLASAAPDPRRPERRTQLPERTTQLLERRTQLLEGTTRGEGCRFAERCPSAMPVCATRPSLVDVGTAHQARCWLYDGAAGE